MTSELSTALRGFVNRDRLLDTATRIMAVHSPTGAAGGAADCLASILKDDGFRVERPAGGHDAAPAVVVRYDSGGPGRTLQFDGHLDTVHLPFVAPRIAAGQLLGSGAADMKGGLAAAVEGLRALRDSALLKSGQVLLVAHELHEAPWGLGQQLDQLIAAGVHGDAVLIPEPCTDVLPVAGRGAAVWKIRLLRDGPPVHEIARPADEPDVIAAGARLVTRLGKYREEIAHNVHPLAGCESIFIGQIHSGEIYNQFPQECTIEGTRRWLASADVSAVEAEFRALVEESASESGVRAKVDWKKVRGAYNLDVDDSLVATFQSAYRLISARELPFGAKQFVDDGNSFWSLAEIPAITHGPRAGGQHTVQEWVEIDDLVRVAQLYALTAVMYCPM